LNNLHLSLTLYLVVCDASFGVLQLCGDIQRTTTWLAAGVKNWEGSTQDTRTSQDRTVCARFVWSYTHPTGITIHSVTIPDVILIYSTRHIGYVAHCRT